MTAAVSDSTITSDSPVAPLASLAPLLRNESGLTRALGDPEARLAVVEVARPIAIAGLAHLSNRQPLVVACPTGTMAGQLVDDLAQFLPAGDVVHFPGWETLPFERVSPSVETMGQRLDVLWRLGNTERCPKIIVAGVRALLQKLGPDATVVEPIIVRPGAEIDPEHLVENPETGELFAASSPDAAPSSTCTRRRRTHPFASTCGATRSIDSPNSG